MKKINLFALLALLGSAVFYYSCSKVEPLPNAPNLEIAEDQNIVAATITPFTEADLALFSDGTMNPDDISYEEFQELKKTNGAFPAAEYESRLNAMESQNPIRATCTPTCQPWKLAWTGPCLRRGTCISLKQYMRIYGRRCKRSDCTWYYYESGGSLHCCD